MEPDYRKRMGGLNKSARAPASEKKSCAVPKAGTALNARFD